MEIKRTRSEKKINTKIANKHPADIIKHGLNTEHAVKLIEQKNTLVFACDRQATKPEIKSAFIALYKADVKKVNTLITMRGGYKKAFVILEEEGMAQRIANEAGII